VFEKHLEDAHPKHFSAIYLIIAKEDEERRLAVKAAEKHISKILNNPKMSTESRPAAKWKIGDLLGELQSSGFFDSTRLVIVHDIDDYNKDDLDLLYDYIKRHNPAVKLVMTCSTFSKASNFYKTCEKEGVILEIAEEKPWEKEKNVAEWLAHRSKEHGKSWHPQALQALLKQVGPDKGVLEQELFKLICYVGDRPNIAAEDVSAVCLTQNIQNTWLLGESLLKKDFKCALEASRAAIEDGSNIIQMMRQARSQFSTHLQIATILENGMGTAEVVNQYPYMKGSLLERNLQTARQLGTEKLKKAILAIDETELQAKNSQTDPQFLADQLIFNLTRIL
jgi:DNA polymerase-3 subunit delta